MVSLRKLISSAEPAAVAPLTIALADAEQRLRQQEARAAQADARMAAAERNVAAMRESFYSAQSPSATDDLRCEITAMEARLSRETAALRTALEGFIRNPPVDTHSARPPPTSDHLGGPPRPPARTTWDTDVEVEQEPPALDDDMTRSEFYLRGDECIRWWMSRGVGVDIAITHAFRTAFHDVIIANLSGSDVGYAKDALEASVNACAALAAGRITPLLVLSASRHVTYLVVKAVYDGQRAVKVVNLMRQSDIPDSFRHVLQASAYDTGAKPGGKHAPHGLRPTLRRFEEAAEIAPRAGRSARSPSRSRPSPTTRPSSKPKSKPSGKGSGHRPTRPPDA